MTKMLKLRKYNVCRLCLSDSSRLFDVRGGDCGVEFSLPDALQDLLQIEVTGIGVPWLICTYCLEKLVDFRLFKTRCQECKIAFETRIQKAVHLKNRSGKACIKSPVSEVGKDISAMQEGHTLADDHESNTSDGIGMKSDGTSSEEDVGIEQAKPENSNMLHKVLHDKEMDVENAAVVETKEESVAGGLEIAVDAQGSRVVGDLSGETRQAEDSLLLSTKEETTPVSPAAELEDTLASAMESSSHGGQCKTSNEYIEEMESCTESEIDSTDDDSDGGDESYEPEEVTKEVTRVPFHVKERIVAAALEHPKWSVASLNSRVSAKLKNKSQLESWKRQVALRKSGAKKRSGRKGRTKGKGKAKNRLKSIRRTKT